MKFMFFLYAIFMAVVINVAQAEDVIHEEFLFDDDMGVQHGSNVLQLKNGNTLLCWYAGSAEAQADVKIYCHQRTPDGVWGERYIGAEPGYKPKGTWGIFKTKKVANVILIQDSAGVIYMFWSAIPISGGFSNSRIDYKFSMDGYKWSKPTRMDHNIGAMVRNKPIHLEGDEYAIPAYDELAIGKLNNYGYHWKVQLKGGDVKLRKKYVIPGKDHIQPSIVKCSATELCAYMRNKKWGLTWMSRYDIKKAKWGPINPTDMPNSNSPVDTIQLSSGETLIVFNDRNDRPRSPLTLGVTSGDGLIVKRIMNLETDLDLDFHYPSIRKDAQGIIHLSYTANGRDAIKYRRFNEAFLKANGWVPKVQPGF